jgi:hypothetical protein
MNSPYDPCSCNSGKKFKFCCYKNKKCGLCGSRNRLIKTACCNNWICDDEDKYVLFSYDNNSCHRNHKNGTLCGIHHEEGHAEKWQDCVECKKMYSVEMYVYFATSGYNFEQLKNPPSYAPIKCYKCSKVIHLGDEDCTITNKGYICVRCLPYDLDYSETVKRAFE